MYAWGPWYIKTLENEQRKLSRILNGHYFSLGCPVQAHNISRCSKLTRKATKNSNGHNFLLGCMCEAHDISRRLKINNGSSREIQMVITFNSAVQFQRIIYRDVPNSTWKPSTNWNGHTFWLRYMLEARDVSRRSKMNNRSSRENQMVFTFQSDVQFRCIIYEDTRNWTQKLSANLNGHTFWLGYMPEVHDVSRR